MQFVRRPLAPNEADYEWIGLVVSLGGFGLAATWLALHLPWPVCLFHLFTGHPCPTCGATRSTIAFFHGQFLTACEWNPFVFGLISALSLFDVYAFVVLVTRSRRIRVASLSVLEKRFARVAVVVAFALNWAYLLSQTRKFS